LGNAYLRREVEDRIDASQRPLDDGAIADIAADQFHVAIEGKTVIENPNVVPVLEQMVGKMRANEACATRDQNPHGPRRCNWCSTRWCSQRLGVFRHFSTVRVMLPGRI
jgi:hypothetical protein